MNILINKEREEKEVEETKKKTNRKINKKLFIIIFISTLVLSSVEWIYANTGNVTIEQLIFHLKVPIQGTNTEMIFQYIITAIPLSIILAFVITIIVQFYKNKGKFRNIEKIIVMLSVFGILIRTNVFGFVYNQISATNFIQDNYIDVQEESIIFPNEKNNLIYIYLESMESTFTSVENGGIYKEDYIKELRELAEENIHFSNTNKLGGALQLPGTNWTIAGMVAQTAGIPLKISIEQNSYDKYSTFLPGITTLGEVLEQNGYKNYLTIGSDVTFGGRKNYFTQHGNYKIWDFNTAVEEERMKVDDKVWWGFDDKDLFSYAKEQLSEISKKEEPFNYTLLTVDTHFVDGYVCSKCEKRFDNQYANVIACSSKQVNEFIKWIKGQEFYENTTIIIIGDHLTMQVLNEEKGYQRTIYNAIINPASNLDVSNINTNNRQFSTMDMFPTTLAAIGVTIKDERLGLGTNLFSKERTLIEIYGFENLYKEIERKSKFYDEVFIYNK